MFGLAQQSLWLHRRRYYEYHGSKRWILALRPQSFGSANAGMVSTAAQMSPIEEGWNSLPWSK
ncbi:hypothetical protein TRIATDRAFT_298888 [Trichoderma atroviride IMI 206040]|uniref:Uncharacterized protein n=1 Tax=Hypocrea atroviridis (strain ATCC 20476 / IMI 206040) TaxID=452589 RepID=G9NPV2_HYPAI|nr:uncharacterized protein TRIATDRAFT_298888 [Trichoderma atroviride IMI 206040]EHK47105.1 hypothetical protein TRIATDRAFT_298888 [Trichoderma atroviride IMI 206040]